MRSSRPRDRVENQEWLMWLILAFGVNAIVGLLTGR
jgi:hypothetical protein